MKQLFTFIMFTLPLASSAQTTYDLAFGTVKFGGPGVTIINKVGNGTTAGSVVLYRNVITLNGQAIDAIVRLNTLSAGAYMVFDQAGTGTGYTNNKATWFSPQFLFPAGGGSALFSFDMIIGGSYNDATRSGTPVILKNVMVNSYDIDGNGEVNSRQYSEFGGFYSSEMATATSMSTSYNATTNLTTFSSTVDTNVVNAADPNTRVRVTYQNLSTFNIAVGAAGEGVAYFFIDFDAGTNFDVPTKTLVTPTPDANTTTSGNDNSANFCSSPVSFTSGGTNIPSNSSTPSGGTTLERLKLSFPTTAVLNGSSEQLVIDKAVTGGTIALNFANGASIPNVFVNGKTYAVTAAVVNGVSSLTFMQSGSATMPIKDAEKLMDNFQYRNTASTITSGARAFEIRIKDGAYESRAAVFTVNVGYNPTISQQAINKVVTAHGNTSFTVNANADTYTWQVDPGTKTFSDITDDGMYSGAHTNTLTLTNVPFSMDKYKFRVITAGGPCTLNSTTAALSVLQSLPVTWNSFTGKPDAQHVELKWSVVENSKTQSYAVQSSVDGVNFKTIANVNVQVKLDGSYQFTDVHPSIGANYYRIEQFDADGTATYSKLISVNINGSASFKLLGNPVNNGQISVQTQNAVTVLLYNSIGSLVQRTHVGEGYQSISVSGISRGVYTLVAGTDVKKVMIN